MIASNASPSPTVTIALSRTGTSTTSHSVALAWTAPGNSTDPVSGYNVYRAPAGSSSYQQVNSSVDAQTAYTDTSVQAGSSYSYYAASVDASGVESAASNIITVSIP